MQRLINQILGAGIAEDNCYGPITDLWIHKLPLAGISYKTPECTRYVQARLGCSVDGIFLNETKDALIGWQSSHSLECDGICGYHSYRSITLD